MALDIGPTRKPLTEQLDDINANMPASGIPINMALRFEVQALDDILTRLDWETQETQP